VGYSALGYDGVGLHKDFYVSCRLEVSIYAQFMLQIRLRTEPTCFPDNIPEDFFKAKLEPTEFFCA
jgi:hypothetical protein